MQQRFLDPSVLASISNLELVAKTVVDGFVAGLHRSPDFGFSQEFAEYRMYSQGDDLRHVDWNVFARTERCYLKRYRGETNTLVTVLLDASNSMAYTSHTVTKLNYARFIASSLLYLANHQRDATGVVVFDDEVRNIVRPSSRQGQLARLTHAIEHAEPGKRTDFQKPFVLCQELLKRRGIIIVISDFWADPALVVKTMQPLRYHGNELVLVHILDPQELRPELREPRILLDMETDDSLEVSPEYVATDYRQKIDAHVEALRSEARGSGIDYFLARTDRPLDECLREYLMVRQGRM
ncbi:MAG: DUF58 domain-containing protein [Bryobacteraceae bacterium]|nr:DUF58 domain-containing protein [Bryobacteraceae bacterium]